jgi:signal transduction histidine kinase
LYTFLRNNRDALIARCAEAVARRPRRVATAEQLRNGIPMFLDQLTRTLEVEEGGGSSTVSEGISGPPGGDARALSEIGVSATAHGRQLMELGYSVDQVVHDYGDLCQAITGLAVERDAPFSIDEFRTLNRCLDNAIADAVSEFSAQRDLAVEQRQNEMVKERIAFMVHELRNALHTASLASVALEAGNLPYGGATGGVLKRSLAAMSVLLNDAVATVRAAADPHSPRPHVSVASLIGEAASSAALDASARGCTMVVRPVDPALWINARREPLVAAIVNLLQNGFKFTEPHTEVVLSAYAGENGTVRIDVADHCGGLPQGFDTTMFKPFTQADQDKSGLGLGLAIARQGVEAEGGKLDVRDVPGTGCIFTITLPGAPDRRA